MLFKTIVILLMIAILYSLGSGLFFLVKKDRENQDSVAKALTWRVLLSFLLVVLLFLAHWFGWIQPVGYHQTVVEQSGTKASGE